MKQFFSILILCMSVAFTGCSVPGQTGPVILTAPADIPAASSPTPTLVPTPTLFPETPTSSPNLTNETLENADYFVPQYKKTVTLNAGKYETGSGADRLMVVMLPQEAKGDLNGDGLEDAAILLGENGGGSGVFVSLIVVYNQGGKPVQGPSVLIDDRPKIDTLTIQDGQILLQATIHGANDPMVSPTLGVKETYQLAADRLDLVRFRSRVGDGVERMIQIDNPKPGSTVSAMVAVSGSMTVAPFENSLVYRLVDAGGNKVEQGSFLVNAVEMGGPATFEHSLDLSGLTAKGDLRLELFEESMADGTILVFDSVPLKIP